MKGDFTRDTFDHEKHFSRVLTQQGRVTLDADHNEQTAILLHYVRTLARDLIGPYAAPTGVQGFLLTVDAETGELTIGAGRYYVDGILVENEDPCPYDVQQDYPFIATDASSAASEDLSSEVIKEQSGQEIFWFYLDVWERLITHIEDPSIREKALHGPDTCARAQVVWQVKALPLLHRYKARKEQWSKILTDDSESSVAQDKIDAIDAEIASLSAALDAAEIGGENPPRCDAPLELLDPIAKGTLAARVDPGQQNESPCVMPPESKYRGAENQLYRVEIHRSGTADVATFKWSRDNGSIVTAWTNTAGTNLHVKSSRGFAVGNWVELSDDTRELQGRAGALVKLVKVEAGVLSVDPGSATPPNTLAWSSDLRNPKVRRWDHMQTEDVVLEEGAVRVGDGVKKTDWGIELENGVQVQFSADGEYRTGDYWLIPARVATGKIEWPEEGEEGATAPVAQAPHGVQHHFAPLAFVRWFDGWQIGPKCDCNFPPRNSCLDGAKTLESPQPAPAPPIAHGATKPAPKRRAAKKPTK